MNRFSQRTWQTVIVVVLVVGMLFLALGGYLSPLIRLTLSPFVAAQRWMAQRYVAVYQTINMPRDMVELQAENTALQNEINGLRSRVVELQQQLQEAQILYSLLDFARTNPENEYVAAAVIGRDPSPFLHYVIIDKGSDDGLRHGMPVVTSQGLVGRVDAVLSGAARIQLINDAGSVVSVKMQNSSTEGTLVGSLTGDVMMENVAQDAQIRVGEVVLSSGLGGKYPSNILVGQIVNLRKRENDLFQTASVQPLVDFSRLQAVLVIKNFKPVDISPIVPTPRP